MKYLALLIIFSTKVSLYRGQIIKIIETLPQILIGMSKPSFPSTFVATAKLIETSRLLSYRRLFSYPVYILISDGGELRGCTLADTTNEIAEGFDDSNGDAVEIDSDEVEEVEQKDVVDNTPAIDFYPALPDIM